MKKIRVVIAGVGSCASSLVQLVYMAKENGGAKISGIMAELIGDYKANDIEFVGAFEVDSRKIGMDLSKAIFSEPNVALKHIEVSQIGVKVEVGPVLDGINGNLSQVIKSHSQCSLIDEEYLIKRLKEMNADVMVCYLPSGSIEAVRIYALSAAKAKVAFINATPEPVATDPMFQKIFLENNTPLLGDDMRSHMGATTLHTALIELLISRGINITNTYQLNFGGNTDFLNLSSPLRSASKQKSKRNALNAAGIDANNVAAGPNGYVQYLGDSKVCYLRLEATSVLESQLSMEIRLQVEDSPNSAGVIISGIRAAKLAKDQNISGVIDDVCAMLFKSPRYGKTESQALKLFKEFISPKVNKV